MGINNLDALKPASNPTPRVVENVIDGGSPSEESTIDGGTPSEIFDEIWDGGHV